MEKWIEEFRQEIKQLINKWESANTEHTNGWAYGATRVISKFNSAWAKYENENRSVTASKPTPPAESLHEMAKRMCESTDCCEFCPIGCGHTHCVVGEYAELTDEEALRQLDALRKWDAENPPKPVKTYRDDFFEKFPDAPSDCRYPKSTLTFIYRLRSDKAEEYDKTMAYGYKDAWDKPLGYWEA